MAIATRQTVGVSVSQRACVHAAVRTHACVSKLSVTPAAALGRAAVGLKKAVSQGTT